MKRVKTGIKGFDELIQGGIPQNSTIVVVGGPGVGKTIFCLQFLYRGIMHDKEKGLYVSFEQRENELIDQALQFNLKLKNKIDIMCITPEQIDDKTTEKIMDYVRKNKIKRLVIDSMPALYINAPIYTGADKLVLKEILNENTFFAPPIVGNNLNEKFIYKFITKLKDVNVTTILINEDHLSNNEYSRESVSEYLADGVISLTLEPTGGEEPRSITIKKLRKTKINTDLFSYKFTKNGIEILPH